MDGSDPAGEDRTFRINFGIEGTTRLRDRVKEKLKEVMGDYTDDTLVEYVLVLLRNGRSKDEARRELNVFLGDDSVPFISWLWDHLSSYMHLYAQSDEPLSDDVAKSNQVFDDQGGRRNSHMEYVHGSVKTEAENERENLSRTSRSRHSKEWKGLIKEENNPFPLRGTVAKILHSEERNSIRPNVRRRSLSPKPEIGKKRSRGDGRQPMKRDAAPRPMIGASRRLLQFAVRDAVRTVQQTSTRTEPALKRLRSVVSTSTNDSLLEERPPRLRSVARLPGGLSTALKAAAEAAEDVIKDRYSGSVFNRLSHGAFVAEPTEQSSVEPMMEDGEYENPAQIPESASAEYYQRNEYDGEFSGDMTMLERGTGVPYDSTSDNDGYNNGAVRNRDLNISESVSSANKDKKSLTLQYSVAQDADEIARNTRLLDQDPNSTATAKSSSKIVNISVNVNTWKPPQYEVPKDATEVVKPAVMDKKSDVSAGKMNSRLTKENDTRAIENEIARADVQKEPLKTLTSTPGSYTTSRPSDDVDSRTVFVSNVHFAATKDSLSRHFNKFGEVLKVIIVNDAATGQPKGSAYVEFLRKESAESALSLSGTSFMSRSLKVVQKSSMHHEAAAMVGWPRAARGSPFASRLSRAAFSRGVFPGAFRARLPLKPGARSLQWKREGTAALTPAEGAKNAQNASLAPVSNVSSPTGKNLTYIRPETKVDASSGPA